MASLFANMILVITLNMLKAVITIYPPCDNIPSMEIRHEVSITFTAVPFPAFHYHYVLWQRLSYFKFELEHFCYEFF